MLINAFYLLAGMLLLWFCANLLVDGSKNLALKFGVRPLIVGLTIVAFGTSAPELFVSLIAAIKEAKSMAVGNIVGSNIANIALALAIASIIRPVTIDKKSLKTDFVFMLFISILFYVLALDKLISRFEGILFLILFSAYLLYCIFTSKDKNNTNQVVVKRSKLFYFGMLILGCAGIVLGANLLVTGGIYWAKYFGISELVIGITVFAIGTSLPEIATSVAAILKKESDISVGNVIGSNIQNIALVIAAVACITPLNIPSISLKFDIPIMLSFSFALYLVFLLRKKMAFFSGSSFLLLYIAYILHLYFRK